jgi:hypothetical protein
MSALRKPTPEHRLFAFVIQPLYQALPASARD